MVEMSIYGVSFDLVGKQPIVLLKTAEGNRYLPIWIGHSEAAAILTKLQGTEVPHPLTRSVGASGLVTPSSSRIASAMNSTSVALCAFQPNLPTRPSDRMFMWPRTSVG